MINCKQHFNPREMEAILFKQHSEFKDGGLYVYPSDAKTSYVYFQRNENKEGTNEEFTVTDSRNLNCSLKLSSRALDVISLSLGQLHNGNDINFNDPACDMWINIHGSTFQIYKLENENETVLDENDLQIPCSIASQFWRIPKEFDLMKATSKHHMEGEIRKTVPYIFNNWNFTRGIDLVEFSTDAATLFTDMTKEEHVRIRAAKDEKSYYGEHISFNVQDLRFTVSYTRQEGKELTLSAEEASTLINEIHHSHKQRCSGSGLHCYRGLHSGVRSCYVALKLGKRYWRPRDNHFPIQVRLVESLSEDEEDLCIPCYTAYRLSFAIDNLI